MATKKYLSLERLTEYDELIKAEIAEGDQSVKSYVDTEVAKKANASHTHDDRYYTESEVDTKISGVNSTITTHTGNSTIHVTSDNKTQWNSAYSHSTSAHAPSNAQANVIESIKVNGTAQTISSKSVNITVPTTAADIGAASSSHNHDDKYDAKGSADGALASAKTYADNAAATVKNELLNGAGTAYDTLKELGDLIDTNVDAIDALETVAAGKANAVHSHAIADVTGLQSALDGKAASSHGTHVSFDSTNKPKMDGTAAFGTSSNVARADHVHPTDTSRASKTEFDTHTANTTAHITATERTNWGAAYTHSQAAHAPSDAEKNQNAFSYVKVGETSIAADAVTDTLTLVAGTNVTITPDATNDKITISATDTVYTHPNSGVTAGTYRSVTVNAQGHVTAGTNPTTLSGYGITDAASKTHSHAISDITNLQTTLNNAAQAISANTASIDTHTTKIGELETKVGDGFEEITSAEIQALFA